MLLTPAEIITAGLAPAELVCFRTFLYINGGGAVSSAGSQLVSFQSRSLTTVSVIGSARPGILLNYNNGTLSLTNRYINTEIIK